MATCLSDAFSKQHLGAGLTISMEGGSAEGSHLGQALIGRFQLNLSVLRPRCKDNEPQGDISVALCPLSAPAPGTPFPTALHAVCTHRSLLPSAASGHWYQRQAVPSNQQAKPPGDHIETVASEEQPPSPEQGTDVHQYLSETPRKPG